MKPRSTERPERRTVSLRLVRDSEHYDELIERGILRAKTSIWISTANLKDVHVPAPVGTAARARSRYTSLFAELVERQSAGLDVRILCASAPSRALSARVGTKKGASLVRRCPRVHLKMVAIDGEMLYLGSANFTGAGIGAKSADRRNFECGIVSDCPLLLDEMQGMFDELWTGKHCGTCQLRKVCPKPLDRVLNAADTGRVAKIQKKKPR
jgi:phosphatidylserine/phosphatidylglycerophosphate/cardiolipin synthase-like enzyme